MLRAWWCGKITFHFVKTCCFSWVAVFVFGFLLPAKSLPFINHRPKSCRFIPPQKRDAVWSLSRSFGRGILIVKFQAFIVLIRLPGFYIEKERSEYLSLLLEMSIWFVEFYIPYYEESWFLDRSSSCNVATCCFQKVRKFRFLILCYDLSLLLFGSG